MRFVKNKNFDEMNTEVLNETIEVVPDPKTMRNIAEAL